MVLFALLIALVGCGKKSTSLKQDTPEHAVESFFKALGEGNIPNQLEALVSSEMESTLWRHRCKNRGCKGATFKIVKVQEKGDFGATLLVDYTVWGKRKQPVMQGLSSPFSIEKISGKWKITQFGRRGTAPDENPKAPVLNTIDAGPQERYDGGREDL